MPEYVSEFADRHGKIRVRFRRAGYKSVYIKAPFPTKAFWQEYEAAKAGTVTPGAARSELGSINDLMSRFYANPARIGPSETTRKKNLAILGEFQEKHGHRMANDVTFEHLDAVISKKAATAPWQADKLRRLLRRLFAFAKKIKLVDENPVEDTEPVNAQQRTKSKGYHSWTEDEISQFEKRHPIGTKPYLALMLLLWSFQRRGDVSALGPVPGRPGWMHIAQEKSGGERQLDIPIGKPLREAIAAYEQPANWNGQTYLSSQYGRPFTKESFGNWFRLRCNEAGLPHCSAHGLRKAASRRAAEANQSNQSIKSVTGHVKDDEVAHYTKAVEQRKLATDVIKALERADSKRLANRARTIKKD